MKSVHFLAVAATLTALFGTTQASNAEQSANTTSPQQKPSIEHRYPGKPSAPIELDYKVNGEAMVGSELTVEFSVRAPKDVSGVELSLHSGDHLHLYNTPSHYALSMQKAGESEQKKLTVIPDSNGEHYLSAQVKATIDGVVQSKAFLIPIKVGKGDAIPELKSTGRLTTDSKGRNIVVMEAEQ